MKRTILICSVLAACNAEPVSHHITDGGDSPPDGAVAQNVLFGSVLDERNDSISFASGAPVHTHAGAPVDLSSGCPDIYKYAYLESAREYGSEAATNAFAYHVKSSAATASYRVTSDAGTVIDTTPIDRASDGDYVVDLRGGRIATQTGKMTLEVTLGDTMLTACFVNHPMAAPLEYNRPFAGELQSDMFPTLFLSRAMNAGTGISVAEMTFTQYTTEPIHLVLDIPVFAAQAQGQVVDGYEPVGAAFTGSGPCGSSCNGPAALARQTVNAQALTAIWNFGVTSPANRAPCVITNGSHADCMIAARADGADPVTYTAVLYLSQEKTVSPGLDLVTTTSYSDAMIGTLAVSGLIQSDFTQYCVAPVPGTLTCASARDFKKITAVNNVKIDFDPIHFAATTGLELLPAADMQLPAFTWNSGSANL
ncbi:MAG: hypothetical protein QM831_33770 [Kofleriaceae bacterium]